MNIGVSLRRASVETCGNFVGQCSQHRSERCPSSECRRSFASDEDPVGCYQTRSISLRLQSFVSDREHLCWTRFHPGVTCDPCLMSFVDQYRPRIVHDSILLAIESGRRNSNRLVSFPRPSEHEFPYPWTQESERLLQEAMRRYPVIELDAYLCHSFGKSTRLDYGTGDGMTFVMFLLCFCKLEVLTELMLFDFKKGVFRSQLSKEELTRWMIFSGFVFLSCISLFFNEMWRTRLGDVTVSCEKDVDETQGVAKRKHIFRSSTSLASFRQRSSLFILDTALPFASLLMCRHFRARIPSSRIIAQIFSLSLSFALWGYETRDDHSIILLLIRWILV